MQRFMIAAVVALAIALLARPAYATSRTVTLSPAGEATVFGKAGGYAAARADSAGCTSALRVGQIADGAVYSVSRTYIPFDLSGIPSGATIQYARLDIDVAADGSGTDFFGLVFRPTLALPVCSNREAAYDSAGAFEGTILDTSAAGVVGVHSLVVDHTALAPGAVVSYAVKSSRDISGNAPTGAEYVDLVAGAARLVVVFDQ